MRPLTVILLVLLVLLQHRLWFGDGSFPQVWRLRQELAQQQVENVALQERNQALEAQVADLKHGSGAVEELARSQLGMIKQGETFYQVVERK